jgi:hypothetical protein
MSNKVWTFFKKLGHWVAVGEKDINKFVQAAQQSQVLTLLGPIGTAINTGIGVFEKIVAANTQTEVAAATLGDGTLTGAQKLAMSTPEALQALYVYAAAIGMKVSDGKQQQIGTIASGLASFGADFLNLLEPVSGDKLPTPATPAAPVAQTAAPAAPKS